MRVFVYYNLHKQCLSVRALEGPAKGRVVAHATNLALANAEFRVSEAGRQRVLHERQKNVHAGVVGELVAADALTWLRPVGYPLDEMPAKPSTSGVSVTYCPYQYSTFVERASGHPIRQAARVWLWNRNVWAEPV